MATDQTPDSAPQPAAAAPAPDLSALAQPSVQGTQEFQQAQGYEQQAQAAAQRANQLATAPVVSPDAPHANLLSMVTSLATGLSALGTSLATRGAEGGAKEVAQIEGERQQQRIQAQQAAQAQRNQQIQQQLTVADTNHKMGQNIMLMATMHDEMEAKDLAVQQSKQNLATGAQTMQTNEADFRAAHGGMSATDFNAALSGNGATAGQPNQFFVTGAKRQLDAGTQALGADDPDVKALQTTLGNPNASANELWTAQNNVTQKIASRLGAAKAKSDIAAADTATVKSEQEKASQSAYLANVPKDTAGKPTQDFTTWQAVQTEKAKQAVDEGDPTIPGDMLAQNLSTPSQVLSSRSMSKPFYEKVLAEANKKSQELYGKPYNMAGAEQQYDFVKQYNDPNSKTQAGITAANTFFNHAADLNSLVKELQTTNVPLLNAPLNQIAGKFGDADITRIRGAVQPVITEYQNALAAGFAPQAADAQAAETILNPSSNASSVEAAAQQMSHTLLRRLNSADQMYYTHTGVHYPNMVTPDAKSALDKLGLDSGDLQTGGTFGSAPQPVTAGAATVKTSPNPVTKQPQSVGHKVGDTIKQNGHAFTVTSVDASGRVTGAR